MGHGPGLELQPSNCMTGQGQGASFRFSAAARWLPWGRCYGSSQCYSIYLPVRRSFTVDSGHDGKERARVYQHGRVHSTKHALLAYPSTWVCSVFCDDTSFVGLCGDSALVRLHGAVEVLNRAIVAHPQACAHVLQHCDVVTDHENTTLELVQRV